MIISIPAFATIKNRFLSFVSTLSGNKIGDGSTNELSTINRLDMFFCGMEMWLRRPMFGWGIWGFATFSGRALGWSHNNISESFCNFGLIGTFLFHYGFYICYKNFIIEKSKKTFELQFLLILFYSISMLSVALNSQKLYAYIIGILFASFSNEKTLFVIDLAKIKSRERRQNS